MPTRIMALEDDPDIQVLLADMLQAEGFELACAGSIAEFDALIDAQPADLYLIDVGLPDGSGLAVLRSLKRRSDAGIIIVTGRGEESDQVIGLELGADDYVTKPFRRRELLARINAILRRVIPESEIARDTGTEEFAFDGYQVNPEGRRVLRPDGTEIELTTAEFNLLLALLERRGKTLSRGQLVAAIKGRDWEISDRAIDGLVSRLRRKLPPLDGRASPYIRTIHGRGYLFSL